MRVEATANYELAQGVKVSTPTGKALEREGFVKIQRFGRTALRAWSTPKGREAVGGSPC